MKAVITAGGKGTRLFPMTRAIPKELLNFAGIPVIEYGINYLKENGITDMIVIVGTKKSPIIDYLGNGELFGVNIAYVIQEQPLGLGDAISKVEHYIDGDFIVLLGDTIFFGDSDLKEMIDNHKYHKASVTILLKHITEKTEKYGIVKFRSMYPTIQSVDRLRSTTQIGYINDSDNRILSVIEKPISREIQERYKTNYKGVEGWYSIAGLYVINKSFFNYLRQTPKDSNGEIQLTDAIMLSSESGNIILGHILNGKRIDVGEWGYLEEERNFYMDMTSNKLEEIIRTRNNKMVNMKYV